ncbi:MAG: CHAT domain-containing protein [Terriglobia bacterium]
MSEGDQRVYILRMTKGQFAEVSITQDQGLLEAILVDPDGKQETPYLYDAGRTSIIGVPVLAAENGTYSIRVSVHAAEPGGSGTIVVSAPRLATDHGRRSARAQELYAQADWLRRTGSRETWAEALRDYDEAIEDAAALRDTPLLRGALTGKSRLCLYRLNDYKASLSAAKKAVAVPGNDGDLAGRAMAWKNLSSAEYDLGDNAASIDDANRALGYYKKTQDYYWQGIMLGNMAYMYREIGNASKGLAAAQSALQIARSIHDLFGVDFDLETLANLHLAQGDLERSFIDYHQALDALRAQPYPQEAAAVSNGIGELDLELGDFPRAAEAFKKSIPLCLKAHDTAGELKVLSNLGEIALRQHRPGAAQRYYLAGLKTAQKLGLLREQSFLLAGLAQSYTMEHDWAQAASAFERSISIAQSISQMDSEALALQGLGDLRAARHQLSQAGAAYQKAFNLWKEQENRAHMAVALASIARLDFQAGRFAPALAEIKNALNLIESSRATLASRELRTSYFASKHNYYELAVETLMKLNRLHPQQGYDARALAMAERARARTLLDSLDQAHAPPLAGLPPALVARQRHIQEQLDAAYARLRDAFGAEPARPDLIRQLHAQIEDLLRQSDDVEARMRAASAGYAALARGEPVQVSDLERQAVGSGTALLEYWTGERESFLWIVRSHELSSATLPGASVLASLVRQYRQDLLSRSQYPAGEGLARRTERVAAADGRFNQEAIHLGSLLLGPAAEMKGIETLFIVPDGPLWSLPYAALRILAPQRRAEDQKGEAAQYAIRRFGMVEEPSASVLLSLMQRKLPVTRAAKVAIFADPVYTADDPRVKGAGRPGENDEDSAAITRWVTEAGMAHLPRLAGSRKEAAEIAALAGTGNAVLRMGFAAQPEAVRDTDWGRYSIAHFAAHAMVNPVHPAFSGIVLTMVGRNGSPEDGVLWLNDIYTMRMPVSLVVLSGCRTATGQEVPGEGIAGISRAFFFAGARRVMGSLWSIEDQETPELMQNFYRDLLVRRLAASASLRAAQLAMIQAGKWGAPYYWAGFTLEGLPD